MRYGLFYWRADSWLYFWRHRLLHFERRPAQHASPMDSHRHRNDRVCLFFYKSPLALGYRDWTCRSCIPDALKRFCVYTEIMKTLLLVLLLTLPAHAASSYQPADTIAIGGTGGWDYVTIDSVARRLYLAQATRVVVVDIDHGKIVGEISPTLGVHGVAVAPDLKRAYTSNGKENSISVVDLNTLKILGKISVGENPDAIVYDSGQKEIYAFNGKSKAVSIISADTGKVMATVALPGKPEFATVDPVAHRVFVDIEDQNEVIALDTLSHQIVATWHVSPGEEPSALSINVRRHLLFVGCGNQKMVVLDSVSGKVVSNYAIGKGVDATAFDPQLGLVFSSNREGTVTIAHEDSSHQFSPVQTLKTQMGARTMALDTKSHRIYLPAAEMKPPGPGEKRPSVVPGTLKLLVYTYADR